MNCKAQPAKQAYWVRLIVQSAALSTARIYICSLYFSFLFFALVLLATQHTKKAQEIRVLYKRIFKWTKWECSRALPPATAPTQLNVNITVNEMKLKANNCISAYIQCGVAAAAKLLYCDRKWLRKRNENKKTIRKHNKCGHRFNCIYHEVPQL